MNKNTTYYLCCFLIIKVMITPMTSFAVDEVPMLHTKPYYSHSAYWPSIGCFDSRAEAVDGYIDYEISLSGLCDVIEESSSEFSDPYISTKIVRAGDFSLVCRAWEPLGLKLDDAEGGFTIQHWSYDASYFTYIGGSNDTPPCWRRSTGRRHNFIQASWSYCPSGSKWSYSNGRYICLEQYYLLPDEVLNSGEQDLGYCPKGSGLVGNPVNPATGNKVHQQSIALSHGPAAISFDLFYNSMDTMDHDMGYGWSYLFGQSVAAVNHTWGEKPPGVEVVRFDDPAEACVSGWNQIKGDYPDPWVAHSSAVMLDNGYCQIRYGASGEYVWGAFPIRMATTSMPYEVSDAVAEMMLIRPDGKRVLFYQQGNEWLNNSGFSGRLRVRYNDQAEPSGWILFRQDDAREYYNVNGRLLSIVDVKGNYQELSYTINGELLKVENNLGDAIHFLYDDQQRISSINDNEDRVWSFSYDASGNLQALTYPDTTLQQYHYENGQFVNALTGVTDQRGVRFSWYEYDAMKRVVSSYHALGAGRIDIEYLADGVRYVIDAEGHRSKYLAKRHNGVFVLGQVEGQSCQLCDGLVKYYEYDEQNNIISIRSEDGVVLRRGEFDAYGNPGYQIEAADTVQSRRTDYQYDDRFFSRVQKISEPSVYALDPAARRVLHYVYDDYANPLAWRIDGFTPQGDVVQRGYTAQYEGPLHQISQRNGARTDVADIRYFEYYPDDMVSGHNRARLRSVTGEDGVLLRSDMRYTASGRLASERRANGLLLEYQYSTLNNRLELLVERVADMERQTRWYYLATGELSAIEFAYGSSAQSAIYFIYDAARRLIAVKNNVGDRIDYILDAKGNRSSLKVSDDAGRLWKQVSYSYNQINQVLLHTQENEVASFSYDANGLLDMEADGINLKKDYSYDLLRQMTRQSIILDNASSPYSTLSYDYDVSGRRVVIESERHIITNRSYDDLGNLLTESSPDEGEHHWQYDAAGNRIVTVNVQGDNIHYQYDARNRLIYADAPGVDEDIAYIYDECDYGQGRLCRMVQAGQSLFYQYDAWGRISQYQSAHYRYDMADRLLGIVYPSGLKLSYTYDAGGQVSSVAMDRGAGLEWIANAIKHIPYGDVNQINYANGLLMQRDYDQAYRPLAEKLSEIYDDLHTAYDANGHLLTTIHRLDNDSSEYRYDDMQRLLSAQLANKKRYYHYDESGNLLSVDDGANHQLRSLSYALDSNHLLSINTVPINYDAHGHQLNNDRYHFTYTSQGRLAEVYEAGNRIARYTYNGLGQRVKKILADGSGYQYFYDPAGHMIAETDLSGRVLRECIYIGDRLLAQYQADMDKNGLDDVDEGDTLILADNDHDGISNNNEWFVTGTNANQMDSDADGFDDGLELEQGTNPLSGNQYPGDGDMNGNADIDVGDYLLLINILLGDRVPDRSDYLHADINIDGVIDILDLLLLSARMLDIPGINGVFSRSLSWLMPKSVYASDNVYGSIYFVHTNGLGAPVALTDEQANVVVKMTYWPFGEVEVDDLVTVAPVINLRVSGQYYDAESALHYNHYRYYDPGTGRYLTPDPLQSNPGVNPYRYVSSNPLNYVDPMGLDETYWWGDGRGFFVGPRNGNWGGKNWSGGWNPQRHDDRTGALLPVDSADECYMLHDLCWENCTDSCDTGECKQGCDRAIVNCLQTLAKDPLQWPQPPPQGTEWDSASYREWAIWFFE